MPAERVSMRRVREILRLKHACGSSDRAIARSLGIARSTVALTLERLAAAGLAWPLPETLSERVLEAMLYAGRSSKQGFRRKAEPDWAHVHRELRRPGVTLMLLWEEYRAAEPGGYSYSRWCELYRAWEGRLSPTMRQAHPAGERLFVDYAGQTVEIVDGRTGEVREAQVFVAAMGASSYTYAEATWTQSLPDWIGSHTRALAFMGGVPAQLVPDNPKVGVERANWYEPGLNRTYLDMAAHYGTAILPTRVRKPRDKAKVEVAVLVVERWILARLRHRRAGDRPQCSPDAPSRREPPGPVPRARSTGAQAATARSLRVCRVAPAAGQPRLPRRHRRPLLLGPLPPRPRPGRGPADRTHGRAVPQRRARRRPPARHRPWPAHDSAGAHAERAPAARRVDGRADRAHGGGHRPEHRQAHRPHPGKPAASRAGLPRLPGHPTPGAPVRRRAPRGGVRPRPRYRRPLLRLDPVDPRARARPAAATAE